MRSLKMVAIATIRFQIPGCFCVQLKARAVYCVRKACVGGWLDPGFLGIRSNSAVGMLLIVFWQPACVGLGGEEGPYHSL